MYSKYFSNSQWLKKRLASVFFFFFLVKSALFPDLCANLRLKKFRAIRLKAQYFDLQTFWLIYPLRNVLGIFWPILLPSWNLSFLRTRRHAERTAFQPIRFKKQLHNVYVQVKNCDSSNGTVGFWWILNMGGGQWNLWTDFGVFRKMCDCPKNRKTCLETNFPNSLELNHYSKRYVYASRSLWALEWYNRSLMNFNLKKYIHETPLTTIILEDKRSRPSILFPYVQYKGERTSEVLACVHYDDFVK